MNNADITSPVTVQASIPPDGNVFSMQIHVDDVLAYQKDGTSVNTSLTMSKGPHQVVVQAWDAG